MNTFGNVTPPAILLTQEAHKLMREFPVSTSVYVACPVKIASDGSIVPLVANDADYLRIGYSIHTRITTDTAQPFPYGGPGGPGISATVAMRGFMTVQVLSGAAIVPGPVKFAGMVTNPAYVAPSGTGQGDPGIPPLLPSYINIVTGGMTPDTNCEGWALEAAAGANIIIEVVLK